jgi:hypothetical protein
VFGAAGCRNPFTPATPQAPTGTPVLENFSWPDSVLRTMSDAYMNHSASGRSAYYDALADSFSATHAPGVPGLFLNPPTSWDLRLEKLLYDYLGAQYAGYTYSFTWKKDDSVPDDAYTDEGGGYATRHMSYELLAINPDGTLLYTVAVGNADLVFVKRSGRWQLYSWADRLSLGGNAADTDHPSMGWRRLDSSRSSS